MKISNNYTPSFGAKLIHPKVPHKIGKLVQNSYVQTPVSFVKIEPENINDIDALEQFANMHGNFSNNAYYAACALRDKSKYYINNEVYALTSQDSNFEKLDDRKILGLVHINKFSDGDFFIEHIESYPELIDYKYDEYKGIGTAMLDYLKEICHKMSCFPARSEYVKNFYYKNDFTEVEKGINCFVWQKH